MFLSSSWETEYTTLQYCHFKIKHNKDFISSKVASNIHVVSIECIAISMMRKLAKHSCICLCIFQMCFLMSDCTASSDIVGTAYVCPGGTLTFECCVQGNGSTVWDVNLSACQDLILLHSRFNNPINVRECYDGAIVAQSVKFDDGYYTSQLKITFDSSLPVTISTILCNHDNGLNVNVVKNYTINVGSSDDNTSASLCGPSIITVTENMLDRKGIL